MGMICFLLGNFVFYITKFTLFVLGQKLYSSSVEINTIQVISMQSPNPKINQKDSFPFTKKKTASLLLIISLLCSAFFAAGISYAQSGIGNQKYPTAYNSGGPSGAYDYLIFTFENASGTFYAAKDSFGRIIDSWTSTDSSITMQAAHDNCPTITETQAQGTVEVNRGRIVLAEGTFVGHAIINISSTSRVEWKGQGIGRTIYVVNNTGITDSPGGFGSYGAFFYNSSRFYGEPGANSLSRQYMDWAASVDIQDMSIDVSQEPYVSGIVTNTLERGTFANLNIRGYFANGSFRNISATFNTFGIRVYNSTSNLKFNINNVVVSGFYEGYDLTADHIDLDNCMACNCYYGFVYNGGMDVTVSDAHAFNTYQICHLINNANLKQSSFTNLYSESVTSSGGHNIYISPTSGLANVYIISPHFSGTTRLAGGRTNLVHWSGSTFVEQSGSIAFDNNASVRITYQMLGTPTVMYAYSVTNASNPISIINVSATEATFTSPIDCSDTISYVLKYYP